MPNFTHTTTDGKPRIAASSSISFRVNLGRGFILALALLSAFSQAIEVNARNSGERFFGEAAPLESSLLLAPEAGVGNSVAPQFFIGTGGSFDPSDKNSNDMGADPPVPEPMTIAAMGVGFIALLIRRRRS
ncbi:MAG: PEP-CTERM sorting domain-containing protein [Fimbriimonadaceae bacterium]